MNKYVFVNRFRGELEQRRFSQLSVVDHYLRGLIRKGRHSKREPSDAVLSSLEETKNNI